MRPQAKPASAFRDFDDSPRPGVTELYRQNHIGQTVEFVRRKKAEYLPPRRSRRSMWDVLLSLDRIVDDSDPDAGLSQIGHALQAAEAIRAGGQPEWMILTGLIHDAGKVLCFEGEPQWAVVGDTYPVGCAFSEAIVHAELFEENPDSRVPDYGTALGIYEEHCGLDRVEMSWGHDEYLFQVVREHLPEEAAYIIRYHSFYAAHREGAYGHLMNEYDRRMMSWVRRFNPYDLYSKSDALPDVGALRPYYEKLIAKYLPADLAW